MSPAVSWEYPTMRTCCIVSGVLLVGTTHVSVHAGPPPAEGMYRTEYEVPGGVEVSFGSRYILGEITPDDT
jgi:hypothetical protein